MNTRQAIQPSNDAAILSVSFSTTRRRFIIGLSEGCRILRTDNCLPTYQPSLTAANSKAKALTTLQDEGVAIADVLDDRYFAVVGGGKTPFASQNVLSFWDGYLGRQITRTDLHERILGVRLSSRYAAVILAERTVMFEYQSLESQEPTPPASPTEAKTSDSFSSLRGPNKVKALFSTSANPYALGCLGRDFLVLPAPSIGQVQLIPLPDGSKRVFRAHDSALRCIALSDDGSLVATASGRGTLIRVFNTATLDQVAELRRGSDQAIMKGLAISPENRWLACTSDKGTIHVFDLKPVNHADPAGTKETPSRTHSRRNQNYAAHRLSAGNIDRDSLSGMSGRSSPHSATYQGSAQEYYGLRPPPLAASPTGQQAAVSALAAFKGSSFAPRVLRDIRSVASAPFHMGNDPPHWQGGPSHSWTTSPTGHRKRVKNPVPSLPNDPSGRPPKGVLAFVHKPNASGQAHGVSNISSDVEGAAIYVIGGGSDPRWELFELLPAENGGWTLINRGHRKYMTRQFID